MELKMQVFLMSVFFCAVVTGGSNSVRADQIFSVIEVYCGEKEGVFDIHFNLRENFHFLYKTNSERFIWTQKPRAGKLECKLENKVITIKYEQLGDPMAVPPGTWSWLPPPTKEEIANYVHFDVTFQVLVNGIQFIKPTAVIKNCKLPRPSWDVKEVLRISIRRRDNGDDISIYVDRIGKDYKSDAYIGHIEKKIKSNFPAFCSG